MSFYCKVCLKHKGLTYSTNFCVQYRSSGLMRTEEREAEREAEHVHVVNGHPSVMMGHGDNRDIRNVDLDPSVTPC
jgi:hypothetical protein